MRIGVVGCGYWGSKHVRVLSGLPHVEQVAVIDPRPDRRNDLVRTFPSAMAFATLEEALPHIDGVVIATPPSSHVGLGLKAIRSGKHLLVEKPLATSLADAYALNAEAAAAGVVLMVGHTFEHNAAVWALRDYIRQDVLGRIFYLDSARLNLGLYQSDVNVIWDLAPHDVSIFNFLLGTAPDTVSAWGSSFAHTYHEDVAFVRLGYKALDVTAQLHVSWLDPSKVRRITVVGSQQMAVYNDMADEEKLRIFDKGVAPMSSEDIPVTQSLHERPVTYRYGGITSPYVPVQEPLQVQDSHFVECIRDGSTPRTDGTSGINVVRVLTAASLSLREQRVVELQELEP
jgi:predicted dehydrogenase